VAAAVAGAVPSGPSSSRTAAEALAGEGGDNEAVLAVVEEEWPLLPEWVPHRA